MFGVIHNRFSALLLLAKGLSFVGAISDDEFEPASAGFDIFPMPRQAQWAPLRVETRYEVAGDMAVRGWSLTLQYDGGRLQAGLANSR
ncbi:hypothetical protein Tco_0544910 [Tanacetum coccineum]